MSAGNGNGHKPLSAEDLRALRPLTAGDFYWGHTHARRIDGEDDPQDLMFHAVHHAAVRGGIAKEDDLFGFLDRVQLDVLSSVFKDDLEEPTGDLAETPTGS